MDRWSHPLPVLLVGVVALVVASGACNDKGGATPEICAAGELFTKADKAVVGAATGSYEGQVAAQEAWHKALQGLGAVLPPGEIRDATALLQAASTTVSNTTWTSEQQHGHDRIREYLGSECKGV